MRPSELSHGSASDIHEYLMGSDNVTHSDLVGAIGNAMLMLDRLQRQMEKLEVLLKKATDEEHPIRESDGGW